MTPDRNKAARELLAFYAEAGVDAAIGEQANDLLSQPPAAAEQPRKAASNIMSDSTSGPAARTADPRLGNAPARPAVAAPPAPTPPSWPPARRREVHQASKSCAPSSTASMVVA